MDLTTGPEMTLRVRSMRLMSSRRTCWATSSREYAAIGRIGQNLLEVEGFGHLHHGLAAPEEEEGQFAQAAGMLAVAKKELQQPLLFPGRVLFHDHLGDQEDGPLLLALDFQEMADGIFFGPEEALRNPTSSTRKRRPAAAPVQNPLEIIVRVGVGPLSGPGKVVDGGADYLDEMGEGLPHPEAQIKGKLRRRRPRLAVAPVKKEKVQVAAILNGINDAALLGQLLQFCQPLGGDVHPGKKPVQGIPQEENWVDWADSHNNGTPGR
jgi:hypothetical protein